MDRKKKHLIIFVKNSWLIQETRHNKKIMPWPLVNRFPQFSLTKWHARSINLTASALLLNQFSSWLFTLKHVDLKDEVQELQLIMRALPKKFMPASIFKISNQEVFASLKSSKVFTSAPRSFVIFERSDGEGTGPGLLPSRFWSGRVSPSCMGVSLFSLLLFFIRLYTWLWVNIFCLRYVLTLHQFKLTLEACATYDISTCFFLWRWFSVHDRDWNFLEARHVCKTFALG